MPNSFALPSALVIADPQRRAAVFANPGFGVHFTDHLARVDWTAEAGWQSPRIEPYGPISLDPAAAVLHYAQEVFEGLKAYRHGDGSIWTFRPMDNAARYARSARRLGLPELPEQLFVEAIEALVGLDADWVPGAEAGEQSLYLRPYMIATEPYLGVRASRQVSNFLIASPVGPYFASGIKPVDIWVETEFSRAAPGGTGAAKCGGNYAASLDAQARAEAQGCSQVLFLDAIEHRWIEELGGMNLFAVLDSGEIITPELTGTILEGITRDSVITVARELGHEVTERRISYEDLAKSILNGSITEVFACGTAAVITPIGSIRSALETLTVPTEGGVALAIRDHLVGLQYGRVADTHGWLHRLA